ncbi:MAG TPA: hypothetical protein PKE21_17470, partial [Flavobacteriales bacterium]|nr:hypothetical protein [Flavobacteriales bacterium]
MRDRSRSFDPCRFAGGDAVLIQDAGFFVRTVRNPLTEIPRPLKLRARIRDHKGEVLLDWATTP